MTSGASATSSAAYPGGLPPGTSGTHANCPVSQPIEGDKPQRTNGFEYNRGTTGTVGTPAVGTDGSSPQTGGGLQRRHRGRITRSRRKSRQFERDEGVDLYLSAAAPNLFANGSSNAPNTFANVMAPQGNGRLLVTPGLRSRVTSDIRPNGSPQSGTQWVTHSKNRLLTLARAKRARLDSVMRRSRPLAAAGCPLLGPLGHLGIKPVSQMAIIGAQ
jgi:hypothetical protein